jgi:adenosine deaminase
VLSTDDGGVERIDLTHEYGRAARDYRLSYRALKALARASLTYSFLPDADKRRELEQFDAAAKEFEHSVANRTPILNGLALVAKAVISR